MSRHQFARVVSGFTGAGLVFTKWQWSLFLSVECGNVIIGNNICVGTILFVYFCRKDAILPEFCCDECALIPIGCSRSRGC